MVASTYRIERWSKGTDGADVWTPIKSNLTRERAEYLVAQAKVDLRTGLWRLRVVAETPAPAATPERKRRPFDGIAQDQRISRAIAQAGDYEFRPLDPGTWVCDGPRGSFLVTETGGCSCEDAQYVTEPAGGRCKHAIMLGHKLIEAGLSLVDEVPGPLSPRDVTPTRPAEIAADDQYFAIAANLARHLGRSVTWTAKDEAAFARLMG
jgi:hypothetical protein